jgi:peptidoglycan/xylan/chitin deacetylase (PgdA/CDA1 family)
MSSSDTLLQLINGLERNPAFMQFWEEQVHSAFVYAGDDSEILRKLIRRLTGDNGIVISKINPGVGDLTVSAQLDDFCKVMAGVRTAASKADFDTSLVFNTPKESTINIISLGHGGTFLKLEYNRVPVFFSTSKEIIDIDAELTSQNFDVREHFLNAVPLVLYIKWAFRDACWNAPETNACLVIDDPVLKPTHGFVNFQELLSLMKRHKFSTSIAFIPWNWRRSAPQVVRLFKENPDNYSISVHGCDHTRAEFGGPDRRRLYCKTRQALDRMNRHESITGICHDRVMVFPQGIFSEAAMSALKHSGLIAAVNSDVISSDSQPRAVTISELWDIAVMGYSDFPIFTRRYPWEGIANFAFDVLLGKPAIVLIHHDYCSDHCARLIDFIKGLNALKCPLTWSSLGEVVRRSCRQTEVSPDVVELEMYGTELRIENPSGRRKRYLIQRRESEPSGIKELHVGSEEMVWNFHNGRINFEIEVGPGQSKMVGIRFHALAANGSNGDNLLYTLKAMLRRYLCEIRDNYIMPTKSRLAGLTK